LEILDAPAAANVAGDALRVRAKAVFDREGEVAGRRDRIHDRGRRLRLRHAPEPSKRPVSKNLRQRPTFIFLRSAAERGQLCPWPLLALGNCPQLPEMTQVCAVDWNSSAWRRC